MLCSPMPRLRPSLIAGASKPTPSSWIDRLSARLPKARRRLTLALAACFCVLASASCVMRKSTVFTSSGRSVATPSISIVNCMPACAHVSSPSCRSAAGRPSVSSITGRSRCDMPRTSSSASFKRANARASSVRVASSADALRSSADSISSFTATSVCPVPSCSSRERCTRSSSCELTTWRARRVSLASLWRCSLKLSTSAQAKISATPKPPAPPIHNMVLRSLAARLSSSCIITASTSSR